MSARSNDPVPEDLQEFIRVCESGRFYESLVPDQEHLSSKARGCIKKRFFTVLFGPNKGKSPYPNAMKARFRQVYPSAAKVLRALKKRNYRHSSHVLQNYESTLFIDLIAGRIMKDRQDLNRSTYIGKRSRGVTFERCFGFFPILRIFDTEGTSVQPA